MIFIIYSIIKKPLRCIEACPPLFQLTTLSTYYIPLSGFGFDPSSRQGRCGFVAIQLTILCIRCFLSALRLSVATDGTSFHRELDKRSEQKDPESTGTTFEVLSLSLSAF